MQSEAGAHLDCVQFLRVVANPVNTTTFGHWGDDDSENPSGDNGSRVWIAPGAGITGIRPSNGQELPQWVLQVNKQTPSGRNGHAWYFGCLTESDLWIGERNELMLSNWKMFELFFRENFLYQAGFDASKFKVQHVGLSARRNGEFEPIEYFQPQGALRANKWVNHRLHVPPARFEAHKAVMEAALIARQQWGHMAGLEGLENPWNGAQMQDHARRVVEYAYTASAVVLDFLHKDHEGTKDCEIVAHTRTGPLSNDLSAAAQIVAKFECEEGDPDSYKIEPQQSHIDTLNEIQQKLPDTALGGIPYYTLEALRELMDIARPYLRTVEFLARGDFLIPEPKQ